MKIDPNLINAWLDPIGVSRPDAPPKPTDDGQTEFPPDRVDIRDGGWDTVRAERIAMLQEAVTSGTYHVRSEDIADAIIRDWQA